MTKLTVRLPAAVPEARVVALHAVYGEAVRAGATVLTLRIEDERHVIRAPRAGRLLPLAGPGDELRTGDALFALHFDRGEAPATASGDAEAALAAAAASRRSDPAPRRPHRGRHVPVLDRPPEAEPAAPAPAAPAEPAAAEPERSPPGLPGTLLRVLLALLLFLGGVLFVLPLLAEAGFGASAHTRLAIMTAPLALGLLLWRMLTVGAGRAARLLVGTTGAAWVVAVLLGMSGLGPLPQGPVALPDSHAMAPAVRVRVPPARPSMVLADAIAVGGSLSDPLPSLPGGAAPALRVADTALPVTAFALRPPPPAVPPVRAAGDARALVPPPAAAPADAAAAATPVEVGRAAPAVAAAAGPPAGHGAVPAAPFPPAAVAALPELPQPAPGGLAPMSEGSAAPRIAAAGPALHRVSSPEPAAAAPPRQPADSPAADGSPEPFEAPSSPAPAAVSHLPRSTP